MVSQVTEELSKLYAKRHESMAGGSRTDLFGTKPYANWGYWEREGLTIEEACDALTDLVARAAKIGPGDRVLEVGCGYGAGAVLYFKKYQPSMVIGIDATDVRIQAAREFIAENGLSDRITVGPGDATAMEFEAGAFTKILAVECAFHFDTRRDFFREAARVLAPGGMLAMTDIIPKRGTDRDAYIAKVHFPVGSEGLDVVANVYDADTYASYLAEAGFEEIRVDSILDRVGPAFADHMEGVGRKLGGPRGDVFIRAAQVYRDYFVAGVDYVLVSAKRS
jgi:ubiquinone/menaquinone biosynthesis C-methylase UbiE